MSESWCWSHFWGTGGVASAVRFQGLLFNCFVVHSAAIASIRQAWHKACMAFFQLYMMIKTLTQEACQNFTLLTWLCQVNNLSCLCWLMAERRTTALLLIALCPFGIKSSHKHNNVRWLCREIMARTVESKTLLLFLILIGNREGELNKVLKEGGQQGCHFEKKQKAPDGCHFHRAASAVCDT